MWSSEGVSIQLISPASGETAEEIELLKDYTVSIQLISPASGEELINEPDHSWVLFVSIQLISPASGERTSYGRLNGASGKFPFN